MSSDDESSSKCSSSEGEQFTATVSQEAVALVPVVLLQQRSIYWRKQKTLRVPPLAGARF
jgi:hypothetical protein